MLPYPILSTLLKSPLGNGKKIRRENKLRVSPRHFVLIENIETRCFSLARNSFSFPFVPSFSGGMNNCWKSRNLYWKVLPPPAPDNHTVLTVVEALSWWLKCPWAGCPQCEPWGMKWCLAGAAGGRSAHHIPALLQPSYWNSSLVHNSLIIVYIREGAGGNVITLLNDSTTESFWAFLFLSFSFFFFLSFLINKNVLDCEI